MLKASGGLRASGLYPVVGRFFSDACIRSPPRSARPNATHMWGDTHTWIPQFTAKIEYMFRNHRVRLLLRTVTGCGSRAAP
jgi:hypothetical protein